MEKVYKDNSPKHNVERTGRYDHLKVETKWQEKWKKRGTYYPQNMLDISAENKYYNLWMFPYPSAEGVHVGTIFSSTGGDVHGRYKRMSGKVVFQPIGYDSFGIHSENYAIKIGEPPQKMLARTLLHYQNQFAQIGHGYDWTRTVTTSNVDYYRWTQWLFVEMFKAGLAYRKKSSVNWCPSCKTVLADEQVMTPKQAMKEAKDAKGNTVQNADNIMVCERCGTVAEIKLLEQWFFRITDYAEKLLENLSKIDWPERIKTVQTNWIGKKEGIEITYAIKDSDDFITVWTSRPDTNFGATFIVISPEHPKAMHLATSEHKNEVAEYIKNATLKSKEERITEGREKTGVFTGSYAVNQLNGYEMPIYITDFVLINVGTGGVVGVPAHDERDFSFARKFGLPIKKVIDFDVETHSVVIKNSVTNDFIKEVEKNKWYWTDYEGWGYGLVIPKGDEDKYINLVQTCLNEGKWYVHTDGSLKVVIFKNKYFEISTDNDKAKAYAKEIGIPESQIDWDKKDNYMFCYTGQGIVVNSDFINGLDSHDAINKISDYLEKKGWGRRTVNYHLRDWLISRQRYWGPPIPMIYCEKCAKEERSWFTESVKGQEVKGKRLLNSDQSDWDPAGWFPEENLPVELPPIVDYKPEGEGKGPLAKHPDFYETVCPNCGDKAVRETDVSDTFLDSSWYFLAYPNLHTQEWNQKIAKWSDSYIAKDAKNQLTIQPFNHEVTTRWLPVDLYFGGAEHAVLHLMYSRFVTMVLNDLKYLTFEEPFPRFYAHGLMIKDGSKMSKSRGNIVNPDVYIEKFGADTLRLYLMFMGPMDGYPDFRDTGIEGMRRFVDRLWELFNTGDVQISLAEERVLLSKMHKTVKRVTEDIEGFRYNTAIAAIMEYTNFLRDLTQSAKDKGQSEEVKLKTNEVWEKALKTLALLLAPFAPHMTEEVWQTILVKGQDLPTQSGVKGKSEAQNKEFRSIHLEAWPTFDPELIKEETVQIVVQVNGKLRGTLTLDKDKAQDKAQVVEIAKIEGSVAKWLEGKEVKKEIVIPGKLVNFVI